MPRNVVEIIIRAKDRASKYLGKVSKDLGGIGSIAKRVSKSLTSVRSALAGIGLAFAARNIVMAGANFEQRMANVSTLVDTSTVDLKKLRRELLRLPGALGPPTRLADALYQALSAGIEPAKAVRFVGDAAKFAKAGLTDAKSAVDLLTTVINAYGLEASDATRISDILFKSIELGKTTAEELAHSLGRVIPAAAALDVELEEVAAAVATLTKGGIKTDEAVTSLNATMMAFLQPTEQARELAKKYGIELSASAVKAKGLRNVLAEIAQKVKGDAEATAVFFGNIRALKAALALTGKQAEEFDRILGKIKDSAGATEVAFGKQTKTIKAGWEEVLAELEKVKIALTDGLSPALVDILKKTESVINALLRMSGAVVPTELEKLRNEAYLLHTELGETAEALLGAAGQSELFSDALLREEDILERLVKVYKKIAEINARLWEQKKPPKTAATSPPPSPPPSPPQKFPEIPTEDAKVPGLITKEELDEDAARRAEILRRAREAAAAVARGERERQAQLQRIRQEAQLAINQSEAQSAEGRKAIALKEYQEKKRLLEKYHADKQTKALAEQQFRAEMAAQELDQFTAQHEARMALVQQATDFAVAAALDEHTTRKGLALKGLALVVRMVGGIAAQYLREQAASELKAAAIEAANAQAVAVEAGGVATLAGIKAAYYAAHTLIPGIGATFVPAATAFAAVAGGAGTAAGVATGAAAVSVGAHLSKAAAYGVASIAVQAAAEIAARLLERKAAEGEQPLSFAGGGYVPPGRHRAILHGPEFVNTPAQLAQMLSLAAASGSSPINVNATFNGPISSNVDVDRMGERLGFALERGRKRALMVG